MALMSKPVVKLLDEDPWNRTWNRVEAAVNTHVRYDILVRLRSTIGDRVEDHVLLPVENNLIGETTVEFSDV